MCGAYANVFAARELPDLVFQPAITTCAWVDFASLCTGDGWSLLSALAQQHGDAAILVEPDSAEPRLIALTPDVAADAERYGSLCDEVQLGLGRGRWWGESGQWGIHGSLGDEVAVLGQVGNRPWPRSADCDVRSIDSVTRGWKAKDFVQRLLATYDAISWDPALEDQRALPELVELCRAVGANGVDPVVAIRQFVDLLDRVPKHIRRIAATDQLHAAWSRTHYLLLGEDRSRFGPLLLAQNDRNHERHANEESALVRQAADEILAVIDRVTTD